LNTPYEERAVAYLRQLAAEARAASIALLRRAASGIFTAQQFIREMNAAEDAERLAQSYEARAEVAEQKLQKARR
jgi:hypothetical protein